MLHGNATLLLTLGLLAPAVIVIRVPVMGTHRSVGPVTDDAVAGTAGAASAGQADGIESARLRALVSRLALARAHFLQEDALSSPCSAHDAVIIVSNPVVPTHRCPTGRAALWSQEHLRPPRAWVHTAGTAQVTEEALAGVARTVELLEDVLLVGTGVA